MLQTEFLIGAMELVCAKDELMSSGRMDMKYCNKAWTGIVATLLWFIFAIGNAVYAGEEGDYKLKYEKTCGTDMACTTFNYCTGCHSGVVVGDVMIGNGLMKPAPGNYQEWLSRLERMSRIGCHIPKVLIPQMATYLDGLDNAPLTAKAKAKMKAEAAAKAKEAAKNPGKSNVEFYCIGCHNGLVVGSTKIGAGFSKPKPKNYDEWMETLQRMSLRPSGAGAHIPPPLMPAMAKYLDSLDDPQGEAITDR